MGTSYYRLRQTDFDGQFSYSATMPVQIGFSYLITLFPVDEQNQLTYVLYSPEEGTVKTELMDAAGRILFSQTGGVIDGSNRFTAGLSSVGQGSYLLRITTKDGVIVKRFVK